MDENLLTIREASEFLGVSIDTLRRWEKTGKLAAVKKPGGTHRFYRKQDLEIFSADLLKLAKRWTISGGDVAAEFYCSNKAVFQTRLIKMQDLLIRSGKEGTLFSVIVAIAGEIGNNSYDHNLGNWPDIPGVFFGFDINKGIIILADRGLGILETLRRVRPGLNDHTEALQVAFTEIVSGREPEKRGNGLKFVRKVVYENPINLFFKSGDAELTLKSGQEDLQINMSIDNIRGCLAVIRF